MKKGLIFGLFLIFLATGAFGLGVELTSPVNNAVYVDSNTVIFKCKATGEDLRFIELYNNVNVWGKKAEVSNPASNTDVTFSIKNVSNGDFIWNCKVIDGIEGIKFSPANRSFSVNLAPNNAPTYKGGLSSQSWNINTEKKNAFDLDDYFSDLEGDRLTYSVTGNDNIGVNIDMNGLASFSPPTNWFGTERIYFSANDGKSNANSDVINLTVIKTTNPPSPGTNTAPTIEKIPDQNMSLENDSWYLDLGNYGKDSEDSSSKLTWTVNGVNTDLIKIDIDNLLKRAKFTTQGKEGADTVTFFVSDSQGLNASQSLKVSLYKINSENPEFNEITTKEPDTNFYIESVTPSQKDVLVRENEIKIFKIETSRKGDVEWYLDGQILGETRNYFSFNSNFEGDYNLTVYVSDLDNVLSNSWTVVVKKNEEQEPEIITAAAEPICGNNIIEGSEDCSTCPSDVKCGDKQKCENNICVNKGFFDSFAGITGSVTGGLNNNVTKTTGYTVLGLCGLLFISILTIRRRNKIKYARLTRLEEEEGFFKGIQRKLRERYEKKQERKEQRISLKNLESKSKEDILSNAPSSLSIAINFIKDSTNQGHSKSVIKRALREKGWGRLQIWRAFKKI